MNSKPLPYEKIYNPKRKRVISREEWEATHIPTCNHYPCQNWPDIHWHISDVRIVNVIPVDQGGSEQ